MSCDIMNTELSKQPPELWGVKRAFAASQQRICMSPVKRKFYKFLEICLQNTAKSFVLITSFDLLHCLTYKVCLLYVVWVWSDSLYGSTPREVSNNVIRSLFEVIHRNHKNSTKNVLIIIIKSFWLCSMFMCSRCVELSFDLQCTINAAVLLFLVIYFCNKL